MGKEKYRIDETLWTEMSNGSGNRKSKRRNRGSLTKLTKYMRRAFALIVACCTPNLEDDIGMVPQQIVGTNFIYPQDMYIGNSELLTQLLMLEARFNQQTEILWKLPRKGKLPMVQWKLYSCHAIICSHTEIYLYHFLLFQIKQRNVSYHIVTGSICS